MVKHLKLIRNNSFCGFCDYLCNWFWTIAIKIRFSTTSIYKSVHKSYPHILIWYYKYYSKINPNPYTKQHLITRQSYTPYSPIPGSATLVLVVFCHSSSQGTMTLPCAFLVSEHLEGIGDESRTPNLEVRNHRHPFSECYTDFLRSDPTSVNREKCEEEFLNLNKIDTAAKCHNHGRLKTWFAA